MGILEIITGVLLILCSVVIVMLVMAQEAQGGMGAVGGAMMDMGSRSTDARIANVTKYVGAAFFALAVVVNAINILAK